MGQILMGVVSAFFLLIPTLLILAVDAFLQSKQKGADADSDVEAG